MMNGIWLGIIITSILCAGFTGRMQQVTIRSFDSAKEAVELAINLIGIMALWLGIMRVVQDAGLLRIFARWLQRRLVFTDKTDDAVAQWAASKGYKLPIVRGGAPADATSAWGVDRLPLFVLAESEPAKTTITHHFPTVFRRMEWYGR